MKSKICYLISFCLFMFAPKISYYLSSTEVSDALLSYVEVNQRQQATYLLVIVILSIVFFVVGYKKRKDW